MEKNILKSLPIHTTRTGRRGRPAIVIDRAWLKDATSAHRRIPLTTLAKTLGIHRNTLHNHMRRAKIYRSFSSISDEDLDKLLRSFRLIKPTSGYRYAMGFLESNGLRVQKYRVQLSLRRIDGLRQVLRNHSAIDRREYVVPYPNYLWHINGYHKLIRWGIVMHGGADGYDRVVCGKSLTMMRTNHTINRALCSVQAQTIWPPQF